MACLCCSLRSLASRINWLPSAYSNLATAQLVIFVPLPHHIDGYSFVGTALSSSPLMAACPIARTASSELPPI